MVNLTRLEEQEAVTSPNSFKLQKYFRSIETDVQGRVLLYRIYAVPTDVWKRIVFELRSQLSAKQLQDLEILQKELVFSFITIDKMRCLLKQKLYLNT